MNNSGTDSAVVFAQYSIPVKQVTLIADDGTPATAKTYEELFTTLHNDTVDDTGDTIGSGKKDADWIQVTDPVYATEDGTIICKVEDATEEQKAQAAMIVYTVGYTKELAPGETSDPVFDKVKLINIKDGDGLENSDLSVTVTGFAIQSENIVKDNNTLTNLGTDSDPDTITTDNLKYIYQAYFNQNGTNNKIIDQGENTKTADYSNDYDLKENPIVSVAFDVDDAFTSEGAKTIALNEMKKDVVTLTTTRNGEEVPTDEADVLATVEAILVDENADITADEVKAAWAATDIVDASDYIKTDYVRDDTDSDADDEANAYTIMLTGKQATPEGKMILVRLTSVQGATAYLNGFTVEAPAADTTTTD
jgi:hypothetical protein